MGTSDVMTELPLAARGQLQRLGTFCSGKFGLMKYHNLLGRLMR
jgi:hypothetical protein